MQELYRRGILSAHSGWQSVAAKTATPRIPDLAYHSPDRRQQSIWLHTLVAGLQNIIPMLAGLGTIVQLLVLGSLVLASVVCWAIILNKVRQFRRVQRYDSALSACLPIGAGFCLHGRGGAAILAVANGKAAAHRASIRRGVPATATPPASPRGAVDRVRQTLDARLAVETAELEIGLPFLATTASATPFIGLLGYRLGHHSVISRRWPGRQRLPGRGGDPAFPRPWWQPPPAWPRLSPAVIAYNFFLNRLRRMEGDMQGLHRGAPADVRGGADDRA